jgi:ABC-2 type transport system ATP-binding protein
MLRATALTMRYAGVTALDGVSFEARPGEVLGFLGPNGAGKTTAMRICTGYLPPSGGSVSVCGIDVATDSLGARARIGYLPESVPLYPEMRVHEYLGYRAALKNVARKDRKARIEEALAAVELGSERRRVIGQLSKGYRQRVGLADALLHRPDVLILDEPTDGLDPNQRRDVLGLIARLGRERTVVLSTHILPEVESVCARVVILDRGRVIAEGRPDDLMRVDRELRVVFSGDREKVLAAIRALPGVTDVHDDDVPRGASAGAAAQSHSVESLANGGLRSDAVYNYPDRSGTKETGSASQPAPDANPPSDASPPEQPPPRHTLRITCAHDIRHTLARAIVATGDLHELRPAALGLEAAFATLTGRA